MTTNETYSHVEIKGINAVVDAIQRRRLNVKRVGRAFQHLCSEAGGVLENIGREVGLGVPVASVKSIDSNHQCLEASGKGCCDL